MRRVRSAKKSTASSTLSRSAMKVSASFQKSLRGTSFKQISGAAHRLQMQRIFRIRFDYFAQTANVDIDAARSDKTIGAPDGVEELIAGEDSVGTRSQVIEQAKFQGAKRHELAGMADAVGSGINGEAADFENARRIHRRLCATEE